MTNQVISGSVGGAARRTGATREHYLRQKGAAFAYFKVGVDDAEKIAGAQFTLYNFITNSFAFSSVKKELTLSVLDQLASGGKSFPQLLSVLKAKKSTLYLLLVSLERSGLIEKQGVNYHLSVKFSNVLREYAVWWAAWVENQIAREAAFKRLK